LFAAAVDGQKTNAEFAKDAEVRKGTAGSAKVHIMKDE
jgi:hypothetical protein